MFRDSGQVVPSEVLNLLRKVEEGCVVVVVCCRVQTRDRRRIGVEHVLVSE